MTDEGSTKAAPQGVLDNLPSTRPQRRSAKRDAPRAARAAPQPRRATQKPTAPRRAAAPAPIDPPSNGELLASAASAVGELAQLGLKLTEQLLRAATQRIPKP